MDREEAYIKWKMVRTQNGKAFCDDKMIRKFRNISDKNFEYFYEYENYVIQNNKNLDSYKNYRSKEVDFLVFLGNVDLKNITQAEVDDYFEECKIENIKDNTVNTKSHFLKHLLAYFSLNEIDLKKFEKKIDKSKKKMKRMTAKQISEARVKFSDDIKKRFVFEMMYYTTLSMAEIGEVTFENFDFNRKVLIFGEKINKIPNLLIDLVQTMYVNGIFDESFDVMSTVNQMRNEIKQSGLGNITAMDGNETRKTTFWKCPQCGNEYEAIADNWCVKQYTENGENWVVCRERCGNERSNSTN